MTIAEKLTTIAENIPRIYESGAVSIWGGIQDMGKRKDYSYAFSRNALTTFNPPYEFNDIANVQYMFLQASNLEDLSHITINITNQNPNLMYMCCNCYKLRKPPMITFTASVVKTYTAMFANCIQLEECNIYFGDGSQNPISIRNSMQNTFFKCEALKNITFSGKGSPIYLDLSYCKALSYNSLLSLKNALMDVSGAEAGTYSITVSTESYDLLTETDIADFTALGWTITTVI